MCSHRYHKHLNISSNLDRGIQRQVLAFSQYALHHKVERCLDVEVLSVYTVDNG
jgi:hypothetical protein